MKYWGWIKNKLITLKKKIASYTEKGKQSGLKIKDFCCSFIHKIYVRYRNYENRKELTGAIIVWFLAFFFVIGICKIYKSSSVSAKAEEEQSVLPLQTVPHEKLKVAKIENATTPVATSAEETSQQVETQTPVEKETVDVSKLNVSKQLLADDVENMNNKEVVNAADVKTKPSGNYDSSQFVYGIDISYHQGKIDWAKVKQSGVDYAFIRVGNRG